MDEASLPKLNTFGKMMSVTFSLRHSATVDCRHRGAAVVVVGTGVVVLVTAKQGRHFL